MPYLNYCSLQPLVILQNRAIIIVNNVAPQAHTNSFLFFFTVKDIELVGYGQFQVMMTGQGGGISNLRGDLNLRKLNFHTTMKSQCITICGVNLWKGLNLKLKQSNSIVQFKMMYKRYLTPSGGRGLLIELLMS